MTGFVFSVAAIAALLGWLGVMLVRSLGAGRTAAPRRTRQPASANDNSADSYIGGAAYLGQNGGDGGSTDGASSNSCDAGSAASSVDTGGGGDSGGGGSSCE